MVNLRIKRQKFHPKIPEKYIVGELTQHFCHISCVELLGVGLYRYAHPGCPKSKLEIIQINQFGNFIKINYSQFKWIEEGSAHFFFDFEKTLIALTLPPFLGCKRKNYDFFLRMKQSLNRTIIYYALSLLERITYFSSLTIIVLKNILYYTYVLYNTYILYIYTNTYIFILITYIYILIAYY